MEELTMDDAILGIFSLSSVVFCVVVDILVKLQKRLITKFRPDLMKKTIYTEFYLPGSPIATGAILALAAKGYPFPELFAASAWGRLGLGIFLGMCSGWLYARVRSFLEAKKAKEDAQEEAVKEVVKTAEEIMETEGVKKVAVMQVVGVVEKTDGYG